MGRIPTLFLLLLSVPLAHAEEFSDLMSLSLQELMRVPITGSTFNEKKLVDVPSAVTVFTRDEITNLGIDTLEELTQLVPGYQSYRSSNSPLNHLTSSRGRRISSPMAEILLVIDGQRITDSRTSGSGGVFEKYPLQFVKRVEFIRGPGAAVYGSNAMVGVINIITLSQENVLEVSGGNLTYRDFTALMSEQWNNMAVDLLAHASKDEGQTYLVNDSFSQNKISTNDPFELAHVNIKVNSNNTHLNLQHHQNRGWDFYSTGNVGNDINQYRSRVTSISLKQEFEWQQISSWLWFSYNESNIVQQAQLSAPGAFSLVSNPSSDDALQGKVFLGENSEWRLQWHNSRELDSHNNLQTGVEFRHLDVPNLYTQTNFDFEGIIQNNYPVNFYDSNPPLYLVQSASQRDIFGIYGSYQSEISESTKLTIGLRYDLFSGIEDKLSPRLGLVKYFGDGHHLKLLYGEAFRAPSEEEMNVLNNPYLLGNKNLKPETVKTYELIWLNQKDKLTYSLGYFENHYSNSIVRMSYEPGRDKYLNVSQDPTKGAEFEISLELNEQWFLRGNYTYLAELPDQSFREADRFGSLSINFHQPRWSVNLISSYAGKRHILINNNSTGLQTLSDYWQFYTKLNFKFNTRWHAYLQIKNIADKEYQTPAVDTDVSEGVANRGRQIKIATHYKF